MPGACSAGTVGTTGSGGRCQGRRVTCIFACDRSLSSELRRHTRGIDTEQRGGRGRARVSQLARRLQRRDAIRGVPRSLFTNEVGDVLDPKRPGERVEHLAARTWQPCWGDRAHCEVYGSRWRDGIAPGHSVSASATGHQQRCAFGRGRSAVLPWPRGEVRYFTMGARLATFIC